MVKSIVFSQSNRSLLKFWNFQSEFRLTWVKISVSTRAFIIWTNKEKVKPLDHELLANFLHSFEIQKKELLIIVGRFEIVQNNCFIVFEK